jgi:sulfite dehydrogenase (cytochrome) subunit B
MKTSLILAVLALIAASNARGEEKPVALIEAPGRAAVESNCASCHSLDYLRTNSPFLDRKGWGAEVNKMINVFGASIPSAEANTIVDYLTKNFGTSG